MLRVNGVLKQRVVTGSVLAVGFLVSLLGLPPLFFSLLMGLVLAYGAWEWSRLAGISSNVPRLLYVFLFVVLGVGLSFYLGLDRNTLFSEKTRLLLVIACTWWAVAVLWVQSYPSSAAIWGARWASLLMGVFILLPMWLAMTSLAVSNDGPLLVLSVVAIVALADIGAYFTGKAFGRTKLAAKVSPGKTWEGLLGGQLSIAVVITAVGLFKGVAFEQLGLWLLLGLMAGGASVVGDLVESMVKRHRGVKDSGTILPGHGGVLDRIDGLTAALPVFALTLSLLHSRL